MPPIRIVAPAASRGACMLAQILGCGIGVPDPGLYNVAWGRMVPAEYPGLNLGPTVDKGRELEIMRDAGVRVPQYRSSLNGESVWLPRTRSHRGGTDLRSHTAADYWTLYEPLACEGRVHVFQGRAVRIGAKYWAGEGPESAQHPIIRSEAYGWKVSYSTEHRDRLGRDRSGLIRAATRAVEALGLDFGAVDVGVSRDGPIVLEVNRAPGLNERTAGKYAECIRGACALPTMPQDRSLAPT